MNFDLTGLFQRQTQISLSGTSVTTSMAAQTESAGLNLSVGQLVSGQVVAADGDMVQVEVAPGTILQAKIEDGLALLKGMSVSFEVSGISDKQIALRALFQNTAGSETISRALTAAELPVTADSSCMVHAMMKEGMPIDKAALQAMYRQIMAYPSAGAENIVMMNRLQIPVNDANIKQFSDYMNMEHQLRDSVELIADSFTDNMAGLVSEGKIQEAAGLMREFMSVFMPESESPETAQKLTSGEMPLDAGEKAVSDGIAGERTAPQEMQEKVTGQRENTFVEEEKNAAPMTERAERGNAVVAMATDNGGAAGKELISLVNQIMGKLTAKDGEVLQLTDIREWPDRADVKNAVREQIFKQWLMTPEEVADKQKVSDFYSRLTAQTGRLMDAFKGIPGVEQNLQNQISNVNQNLEFIHQLNQTMSYVQLPLKLAGDNAHGDLYVYTNKKNLAAEDGNVSAFLHLDMDHLGPVDVYVAMQQQRVSTQFYLRDEEMLDFIHENIGLLNERLEKKGYQMNAQFSLKEKPGNVMEEIVEDHRENVKIGTYSFDVRA